MLWVGEQGIVAYRTSAVIYEGSEVWTVIKTEATLRRSSRLAACRVKGIGSRRHSAVIGWAALVAHGGGRQRRVRDAGGGWVARLARRHRARGLDARGRRIVMDGC